MKLVCNFAIGSQNLQAHDYPNNSNVGDNMSYLSEL